MKIIGSYEENGAHVMLLRRNLKNNLFAQTVERAGKAGVVTGKPGT